MTGEITLRGRILPVGGLKTKLLAAQREGVRTVLLPKANEHELADLPAEVRRGLKLVLVDHAVEVFKLAFERDLGLTAS